MAIILPPIDELCYNNSRDSNETCFNPVPSDTLAIPGAPRRGQENKPYDQEKQ
jgi:hypothetical protein